MDSVLDELTRCARRCERAAKEFDADPVDSINTRMQKAITSVGKSWCESWIGYQSRLYKVGFKPVQAGEFFDTQGGWEPLTQGEWAEYQPGDVRQQILNRAGNPDLTLVQQVAERATQVFESCKPDVLSTLDALLSSNEDDVLREKREALNKMRSQVPTEEYEHVWRPRSVVTSDQRAIQGGIVTPPHLHLRGWLLAQFSCKQMLLDLAALAKYVVSYLEKHKQMKGQTVARTRGPIFIGHGRSSVWKELKDFLVDRLGLEYEEFNRAPVAGRSNKERLQEMLDRCCFAFLVMTAEDEQADGAMHARRNVILEAGLFQGRYGFERAIILLEDGCEEFSNIQGIGQIRFPKGNVMAMSEEIRRVLEREEILLSS